MGQKQIADGYGTNAGRTLNLTLDKDLTKAQRAVARGLAAAKPVEDIAADAGVTVEEVRRMRKSGAVLAAVGAEALSALYGTSIPLALRVQDSLMLGRILIKKTELNGSVQYVEEAAPVPPAVRLAAAQGVLKLARFNEQTAPETPEEEDLTNATLDRLQRLVSTLEAQLAPSNAPTDVVDADVIAEYPSNYSVLD